MIPALAHLPALGAALDLGQVLWFALGALAFEALRRNINCIVDAINRSMRRRLLSLTSAVGAY
jgi:hypothetical protein